MLMLRRACAVAVRRKLSRYFRVRHDGRYGEGVSSDRKRVLHRATDDRHLGLLLASLSTDSRMSGSLYNRLSTVQKRADESNQRRLE